LEKAGKHLSIPAAPDPYLDLVQLAGDLHQHAGRGVRYIIVRTGGMVDAISAAAGRAPLEADELRTEALRCVAQPDPGLVAGAAVADFGDSVGGGRQIAC
jgi:hypothetical protein